MRYALFALTIFIGLSSVGCATVGETPEARAETVRKAQYTVDQFEKNQPATYKLYNDAAIAKAVFPSIGKGGAGIGGAYGRGAVLQDGELIGYCKVEEINIGFQLGGQAISMIMFFKDKPALQRFQNGEISGDASASAVIVEADASATADFKNGVATATFDSAGAMYQATIGGKRFEYVPAELYE